MGAGFGGITSQPTGYPGVRPPASFQSQQTGFHDAPGGPGGLLQAQPTGFSGVQTGFGQRPPPPPFPSIPNQFQQHYPPLPPPPAPLQQQSSFLNPAQSRARTSTPHATDDWFRGAPQLQPAPQQQFGSLSLQQSFQQHNQQHGRGTASKVPWALSKAEKRSYGQIFRAWDAQGTGFISGQTALEEFGQSALDRNDLAKICNGYHLSQSEIPDELPPELVPPSSRDLDTSVNVLKHILKNDTRARSPSALDTPISRLKERSLTSSSTTLTQQGGRQDFTVYRHEDVPPPGGFYQSSVRHIDRNAVRSRSDEANPAATDIASLKRQLLIHKRCSTTTFLRNASRISSTETLRICATVSSAFRRNLEYVSRGTRTTTKDEERRRIERELMRLMHEDVPELERKVEEREARREREKRKWANERDKRNERFGRFTGEEGSRYSPAAESRYGTEDDRPYSRSGSRYERDERDYYDRDGKKSYRSEEGDRQLDRESTVDTRSATRSPPTATPAVPSASRVSSPPRAASAPSRSSAPQLKNMTPEQRKAYIQAQAKRRLEERMQALGVSSPAPTSAVSPTLDSSVEDRLEREKPDVEEKAGEAERQAEEWEQGSTPTPAPTTTAPAPLPRPVPVSTPMASVSRPTPTPTTPVAKAAPPAPKPRAPAPSPSRKGISPRMPAAVATPALPVQASVPAPAPPAPAEPEEDLEYVALKAREAALRKKREEREALLRKLEGEEKINEEPYQQRRNQFLAAKAAASPAVGAVSIVSIQPTPEVEAEETAFSPPPPLPPPPAPPASTPAAAADKPSNNPFNRLKKDAHAPAPETTPSPVNVGNSNPFFRSQTAPPPSAPTPPKSPGVPPPVKTTYHTVPSGSDDDWDEVVEKEDDDSSDEELATRDTRVGLAQQLFGSLLPARPQSAGPAPQSIGSPVSPTFPPPAASPAPVAPPPPPAPAVPAPSKSPGPVAPSAAPGDRSALLSAIQGGAVLRKTVTNDRSAAATAGRIIGDNTPPAHINATPRPPSPSSPPALPVTEVSEPPQVEPTPSSKHRPKESVDWYNGLAADHAGQATLDRLPETIEEEEYAGDVPAIRVSEHVPDGSSDPMADVDESTSLRVRSLYAYEAQRSEDLSFGENIVIEAHPSKSGGDWWYGTTANDGRSGFFPQTYVQVLEPVQATALYSYEGSGPDELSFNEGDVLTIVDRVESDWWRAERDGVVYAVPAASSYLLVRWDGYRLKYFFLSLSLSLVSRMLLASYLVLRAIDLILFFPEFQNTNFNTDRNSTFLTCGPLLLRL
ncbi:hypothetical protein M404DRAFT_29251 [Pisolithus tinctorius Marx 270]|uniref:Actin cytoskeleton-regulatory complex protein PAN1 n=1 Tax=Pisolithus tinctorius Marx 270 TaxID=870435 RepID=A0A0C3P015_PISTI|nr:hypothetical protein M404DRAFT_29251 [Pisolithus tinctorius Marx 270]